MSNTIIPVVFLDPSIGSALPGFAPPRPRGVRGYGAEAYGDPYGAGGPLSVVFAMAVEGQAVRVVFNEEPAHYSSGGPQDALNPSNYALSIAAGQGTAPAPLGVDIAGHVFPEAGVRVDGHWGFDVRVDRPLVLGMRYRVTARRILSRAGLGLGYTYSAEFMGVVPPASQRPRPRRSDLADMATDTLTGAFLFDGSGDVAVAAGPESYRTRIMRRVGTVLNAFVFLQGYGTRVRLKRTASPAELAFLQGDLQRQIEREPETEKCVVAVSLNPLPGILTVDIKCKTRQGSFAMSAQVQADGTLSFK